MRNWLETRGADNRAPRSKPCPPEGLARNFKVRQTLDKAG